jgi:hypothetical protein
MEKEYLAALIESSRATDPAAGDRLLTRLIRPCWPGGPADRTQPPAAREWIRRWGPAKPQPVVLDCSCDVGRCRLCN